jgi:hypothetical protein
MCGTIFNRTRHSLACSALFQVVSSNKDQKSVEDGRVQDSQDLSDEDNLDRHIADETQHDTKGGINTSTDAIDIEITSPGSFVTSFSIVLSMTISGIDKPNEVMQVAYLTKQNPCFEMNLIYDIFAVSLCIPGFLAFPM